MLHLLGLKQGFKSPSLEGSRGLFLTAAEPTECGPYTFREFVSICKYQSPTFIMVSLDVRVTTDHVTYVRHCQPP